MGHIVGKDLYRQLGAKLDGLTVRTPWNDALHAILKEIYSERDAEILVRMPFGLSTAARLAQVLGRCQADLEPVLRDLGDRGLVLDIELDGRGYYAPSPFMIGVFEFTMMRTGGVDLPRMARLFRDYLDSGSFYAANFGDDKRVALLRTLPHEGIVAPDEHVEVLDYEKATAIVEDTDRFAVGLCSCRHEKHHLGNRTCRVPLEGCAILGQVDGVIRHGFAREISKTEMLELIAQSRELGLVLNADNVQRNVSSLCRCCSCCCNLLSGISRHGYTHTVVTSSYLARPDYALCNGCALCVRACPIEAVRCAPDADPRFRKHGKPQVDEAICLGCGVCALRCRAGALRLHHRKQNVLHPEDLFERLVLQCLERGTLQNHLFDVPERKTHAFLRSLVGGFLRLRPVQQALMSKTLRSRFLAAMQRGARAAGQGALT